MEPCRVGPLGDEQRDAAQLRLSLDEDQPSAVWTRETASHALDELFTLTTQYQSSSAYRDLLWFVASFRTYAPFNAMLVHIQMPGARYVATPSAWLRDYNRRIKPDARPLVILRPMGPVMFVFDVAHTFPDKNAPPLPREVTEPFEVRGGLIGAELERTIANARRDGVAVVERDDGSQSAGEIRPSQASMSLEILVREHPRRESIHVPLRYDLVLNKNLPSREAKYATLAHELGHLYCGHLGTPNDQWWPDRRGLPQTVREVEAESVCYLVCTRAGIDNPSWEYLANHLKESRTPPISLECVMKAAGLVEQMGRERLKPRKEKGS